MEKKKGIYIGESDYKNLSSKYYYVDKTLFIKDIIDRNAKVNLITRPRRFGKTLNMDMLQTFFEKTDEDNSVYFRDKKIWKEGDDYTDEQGKYPVIFLSFKDARCDNWEETYDAITDVITDEFSRHDELASSDKVNGEDLKVFNLISSDQASLKHYKKSLHLLSKMLYAHYGTKPIILIDEYDAPIQQGYTKGYYDKAVSFIREFFSKGLKDNKNFEFGVLTGILRVSKESIFSGLNNLATFTVLDERYSQHFGFTLDEVKETLKYFGRSDKLDEVLEWYDGYKFGSTEIFNPFSLTYYVAAGCDAKEYWANTSGNDILSDLLHKADEGMENKIVSLLQGETIQSTISENVVYADLDGGDDQIFSVLLFSGYLKAVGKVESDSGQNIAHMAAADGSFPEGAIFEIGGDVSDEYLLKIPNKEVWSIFRKEVFKNLKIKSEDFLKDIWTAVQRRDCETLEGLLRDYLLTTASSHDVGGKDVTENERSNKEYEAFYHGMWMGFAAYTSSDYYTISNGESGEGRYDLTLEPNDKRYPAMILEFKHLRNKNETLQDMAKSALAQIDEKHYDAGLKKRGCKNIIKVGIAYLGKDVAVAM